MKSLGTAVAAIVALSAGAAQAHSPYLLPSAFDATGRAQVTVQASFTEGFFWPEVAMRSDTFQTVGPDGAATPLTPAYFKEVTILEAATPKDGTWRITSGARVGRTAKAAFINGEWEFENPNRPFAAGVKTEDMQSITTAEVYVTKGKPSDGALKAVGKGIEFRAITHPSDIAAGQPAQFEVLFDGKPLAAQTIEVRRADHEIDGSSPVSIVSDKAGRFAVTPDRAGVFHAMTRYRVPAAAGAPARSFTYALTFQAEQ